MKVYYTENGDIIYAVPDYRRYYFTHKTNAPLMTLDITENPANRSLCNALLRDVEKEDDDARRKFRVENDTVITRQDFVEHIEKRPIRRRR